MVEIYIPTKNAPYLGERGCTIDHINEHRVIANNITMTKRHMWPQPRLSFGFMQSIASVTNSFELTWWNCIGNDQIALAFKLLSF